MKPVLPFLYCIVLSLLPAFAISAQAVLGARPVALGQVSTSIPGMEWSVFGNPAMMDTDRGTVSFFGIRYYGFTELTDAAAAINLPVRWGVLGAGAHRYGFELFNESRIRVGYKNSVSNFYYGAAINYSHINQGGGYGSAGAWGIDVGLGAMMFETVWIGARSTNINRPEYGDIGEALPRELAVGISYRMTAGALFASEVVKDVRFPVSYRGGVEVEIIDGFTGRAGITTEPTTFSLGCGYSAGFWSVNLVVQSHSELGISPGLDLGINW